MTTDQPQGASYEPTLLDLPVLPYGDAETGRSSGWSGSETSAERAHTEDANGTTSRRQRTVLLWLNLRRSAGCTWKELAEAKGWHHGQASGVLSGLHKEGRIARLAEERRHRCAVYVLPQWVADRPTVAQGREQKPTTFALTEKERAEVERATWYSSRGMPAPISAVAVLLDALARATGEPEPDFTPES